MENKVDNIRLIRALVQNLNMMKDFNAGCSSKTMWDGILYIEYEGKPFAVKVNLMNIDGNMPSSKKIDQAQYWV